ncbi:glycosyltransferase family 2 protein [soil metagenome]
MFRDAADQAVTVRRYCALRELAATSLRGKAFVILGVVDHAEDRPHLRPYLSVIIPAFDEERRIGRTLRLLSSHLGTLAYPSEILVVDDGSRDGTRAEVERATEDSPVRIRALHFPVNRGKGHAVRNGMLDAEGDVLVFYDADGSAPPEEIAKLVAAIARGADVAAGSRRLDQALVERSLKRKLISRGFNVLVRSIVGLDVEDSQCGIKAFQRHAARRIFEQQKLDGFAFDCEVLAIAHRQGWQIVDVPVKWTDAAGSKLNLARASLAMLYDLTRIRRLVADVAPVTSRSWRPRDLTERPNERA